MQHTPSQPQSSLSAPPVLQPAWVVGAGLAAATQGADVCVEQARHALERGHFDDPRDRLCCEAIVEADALRQELCRQQAIQESTERKLAAARARLDRRQEHEWTLAFALSLIFAFVLLFAVECARSAVKIYFPAPRGIGHGTGVVTPIGRLNV